MRIANSLEWRLCLLVTGLVFLLLFTAGYTQMSWQQAALIEEKMDRYESLSNVAALTFNPRFRDDDSPYQEFTNRLIRADRDISYVVIADSKGRVLSAETRELAHRRSFPDGEAGLVALLSRLDSSGDRGSKRISIPVTLRSGERGRVVLGFASQSVLAALQNMQIRLLCTLALLFLLGLLGAISLARTVTSPLRRLITAARCVQAGDLDINVAVSSNTEIGELADTFNRMVATLKESRDKLIERANADSLTGLYNHRYFQERLKSELKRAERYGRPLSVIMVDIDHFKILNSAYGHPVGDLVLREMADIMSGEVRRDIDVLARYGGEEFALILPEAESQDAMACAQRLRLSVQRHCFVNNGGDTIPVTVSLGIAQYPIHSTEREGLIMAADMAMYQSKFLGRNRTTVFNNDTSAEKGCDPYRLYLLLHASDMSTIEAMAAAIDAKGHRYPGFSRDVTDHSVALAQELGWSEKERDDVRIASLLHDIGKLGISEAILNKRESLTDEERDIIRSHPMLGYAVVEQSPHLASMLPGILNHHEWWDGNGYPNRLKGEDIPMIARIIAVVDAYHAMMTERPHCGARVPEDAKAELKRCAGTQFDPAVVDAFLRVLEREEAQAQAA